MFLFPFIFAFACALLLCFGICVRARVRAPFCLFASDCNVFAFYFDISVCLTCFVCVCVCVCVCARIHPLRLSSCFFVLVLVRACVRARACSCLYSCSCSCLFLCSPICFLFNPRRKDFYISRMFSHSFYKIHQTQAKRGIVWKTNSTRPKGDHKRFLPKCRQERPTRRLSYSSRPSSRLHPSVQCSV